MKSPPRVPGYKLHKATGQAFVRLGKRFVYLGKYGSQESHAKYADVVRQHLLGQPVAALPRRQSEVPPATVLTVRGLVDRYLAYARSYYAKGGKPTAEFAKFDTAGVLAKKRYGELPAEDFGPLCLEDLRDGMIGAGLARTTINGQTRRIVAIFKWGAAKQLVSAGVPQALGMVAGLRAGRSEARESKPVRPVDDAIVDATIVELPEVVADMVRLQRYTGARPGEVCKLRPCDIDRSGDVWLYTLADHKTAHHGKRRTVFIGPQGQAVLLKYLARAADTYCFRPCDSEAKRRAAQHAARTTPLSCGNRPGTNTKSSPLRTAGDRYTKDSYARAIARAAKRAKVEKWTPNQLRHTYATAVRRDHGLEAAQVMLGHSGAKVTEIYAERDMAKGAVVARLIG
ncbi:site-specific integrase [Botrimarina sp.]|uniref:tyrosine-type recombinase/integrase n=1 Tax=Botrimarina sp. TaxID=2795802 RepID=UPI0032EB4016